MRHQLILFFCLIFAGFNSFAQEDSPLSFEVGLDLYYGYDFNKPLDRSRQYVTVAARHNEFNLNWGFIKGSYNGERIRSNLALHTGTYPIFNYANEPSDLVKMIAEANAGVKISDGIWLDVGIMPSHIGYENTFSFHNEMYTHSFMAEHTPYFSTGAQLTAAIHDKIDLKVVVLNGWQNIIETNNAKSVGLGINFRPLEGLELNYSNYIGNESTIPEDKKVRFYNHFYGKYFLRDNWHVAFSADYGRQELIGSTDKGNVFAFLGITQYNISDKFNVACRMEHFNDGDEILVATGTPEGFVNTNFGMVFDYAPVPIAKLRVEGRIYAAQDEIYNAGDIARNHTFLLVGSLAVNLRKN
jgi:hypothetical protein